MAYPVAISDLINCFKKLPGIGEKSAILLIDNFGSIEEIYAFIESNSEDIVIAKFKEIGIRGGKKIYEALTAKDDSSVVGKDMALLCKNLATIYTDINFGNLPLSTFETNINETSKLLWDKKIRACF